MKRKFLHMTLAPEGSQTDSGSSASAQVEPPPAAEPNPAPAAQQTAATAAPTPAGPAEPGQEPKRKEGDKTKPANTTLLGEAVDAGKQKESGGDGNAKPNPDGGQTGDGNPTQDPYSDLKLPEGAALDETQAGNYKKLAQEIGLTPQHAQQLLDFEAKRLTEQAAQSASVWKQQTQEKYGDKLPTVMATAARAVDKFGGDELRILLDQTRLGNHPVVVEAFFKAGALLKEDVSVPSNGAASGDKTFTEALYGRRSK